MAISPRQAIAAKCRDCIYDPLSGLGTWRQQVTGCTSPDCALYPFRPLSEDSEELRTRKAEWRERNPNRKPPDHLHQRHSTEPPTDPLP